MSAVDRIRKQYQQKLAVLDNFIECIVKEFVSQQKARIFIDNNHPSIVDNNVTEDLIRERLISEGFPVEFLDTSQWINFQAGRSQCITNMYKDTLCTLKKEK